MKLQIILEKGDDGFYVAHAPALKSCWSQGKTKTEALVNIREAIELFLEPEPVNLSSNQELLELAV